MLLGKAPTNLANTYGTPFGHGTGFVEGLVEPGFDTSDGTCGGVEPHDSSGIVRYTSVRHGGDEIGASNEINGFTLCAVGDNTIFEFNEVYANFDDAFEFFGGTVNANHLVATYVGDDNYDVDWGYTGGLQFLFAIKPFFRTDSNANFGQAAATGSSRPTAPITSRSRATASSTSTSAPPTRPRSSRVTRSPRFRRRRTRRRGRCRGRSSRTTPASVGRPTRARIRTRRPSMHPRPRACSTAAASRARC
jgi:hypothetical protein